METITEATKFEVKKEAAYKTLQQLKNVNAPEADIRKANTMFRFWEAMEQEAGESLGALLYEFAILVNFDSKLLKPIADKDAGFWSDIEGMGFLDFQLKRMELERSNRQISLLQSIDIGIKQLVTFFDNAKEQANRDYSSLELMKPAEEKLGDNIQGTWTPEEIATLTEEAETKNKTELQEILAEDTTERLTGEIDFDALLD
jgi:hypothetical protein